MSIDSDHLNSPLPEFIQAGSGWWEAMNPEVRAFRLAMYEREIALARELIARFDAGLITPAEYGYRMFLFANDNTTELVRLEMRVNACQVHEGCYGKGDGHE